LRASFGLTLFGFDIILVPTSASTSRLAGTTSDSEGMPNLLGETEHNKPCYQLVVIDVNYFPSYSSPGAAVHVWQALLTQIVAKRSREFTDVQ